jgi:hypothetical protein
MFHVEGHSKAAQYTYYQCARAIIAYLYKHQLRCVRIQTWKLSQEVLVFRIAVHKTIQTSKLNRMPFNRGNDCLGTLSAAGAETDITLRGHRCQCKRELLQLPRSGWHLQNRSPILHWFNFKTVPFKSCS